MKVSRKRTKARKSCRFGFRKGTKVCRKHPKRVVHRKRTKRAAPRRQKRFSRGKSHRKNPRYSGLKAYEGGRPTYQG
jgi:hypothetical protein